MRFWNAPCEEGCQCPLCDSEMNAVLFMDVQAYSQWLTKQTAQQPGRAASAGKRFRTVRVLNDDPAAPEPPDLTAAIIKEREQAQRLREEQVQRLRPRPEAPGKRTPTPTTEPTWIKDWRDKVAAQRERMN